MNILRRYTCETVEHVVRYYAVVSLDSGGSIEIGSPTPLSDDEVLALAAQSAPVEPVPVIVVEAEDGTIV